VMDPAVKPERKSGPKRTLIAAFSTFGALVIAVFLVLGRNSWEQRPGDDPLRLLSREMAEEGRRLTGWVRRKKV
jgi:hypothetical protein